LDLRLNTQCFELYVDCLGQIFALMARYSRRIALAETGVTAVALSDSTPAGAFDKIHEADCQKALSLAALSVITTHDVPIRTARFDTTVILAEGV
jgi:hypothetical protein